MEYSQIDQIKTLATKKDSIEEQIKALKAEKENVETAIEFLLKPEISALRTLQGKDTGTVNLSLNGSLKIKHTVPKKVKWDQVVLSSLANMIQEAGQSVTDYMALEYKVSERTFDTFNQEVRDAFLPARKIEYGKPTVEFEFLTVGQGQELKVAA